MHRSYNTLNGAILKREHFLYNNHFECWTSNGIFLYSRVGIFTSVKDPIIPLLQLMVWDKIIFLIEFELHHLLNCQASDVIHDQVQMASSIHPLSVTTYPLQGRGGEPNLADIGQVVGYTRFTKT